MGWKLMMNQMTGYGIKKNIGPIDSVILDSLLNPCLDRWGYVWWECMVTMKVNLKQCDGWEEAELVCWDILT